MNISQEWQKQFGHFQQRTLSNNFKWKQSNL